MFKTPTRRALTVAGACFLGIVPFLIYGNPSGHDFEFHMFSWMEVLGQWKLGIIYPRWAAMAHWGYGEARFLFYPPASWTLGAALGAVLPWKVVPGVYCWLALTLAGASMYRLARVWLPARGALFAALFYALNPYSLLVIYWRSAFAELLAAPLLPVIVLCLLRIYGLAGERDGYRPALWLSLALAAAWLTNAPAALMIHYSTAGLALFLAARDFYLNRSWRRVVRPLGAITGAIVLGAGIAAVYLIPAVYEQDWINLSEVMAPGVRPQDNFLFTNTGDADHNRFNLLVSILAVAEIAALAATIAGWKMGRPDKSRPLSAIAGKTGGEQTPRMLLSAWAAASAFLMISVSNLLWVHLPKFRFIQLPFRWLLCMNAALAVLLVVRFRWALRYACWAALVAVLIIAGHRIQPPWWDGPGDIREMKDAMSDGIGNEGIDEYVPAGDDPYELDKNLPRVVDSSGRAVRSDVLKWTPTEKHFSVNSSGAQELTVRLLSYPAWDVQVNGNTVETGKTDVTGLVVIPVGAGESDVRILFRRTVDRLAGDIVSLISIGLFIVAWIITRPSGLRTKP